MKKKNQIMLESKPCPICKSNKDTFLLKGYDRINNIPGLFNVVKCKYCGLLRTDPRPTSESMSFYYPDTYPPFLSKNIDNQNSIKKKSFLKSLIQFNFTNLPDIAKGNLLELGCASGDFLCKMANEGWNVTGIEQNTNCAQLLSKSGYKIFNNTLENMPDLKQSFDLIVGWMVLEHVHDPVLCLKKLNSWSVKDGWLVLSVPNADSIEFALFKDKWFGLQLPTHLYHFTPKTIKKLLEKNGWKVHKIFYQRQLNDFIASFGYYLKEKNKNSKLSEQFISFPNVCGKTGLRILFPLSYLISLFGKTSRMTIWARKSI